MNRKPAGHGITRRRLCRDGFYLVAGSVLLEPFVRQSLTPTRVLAQTSPKRIYLAPDDHTDYYWSAGEDTYRQVFLETIDYYLDQADATSGNPPAFQGRWHCDGSFWIWTYERNRTATQFSRLIDRVRDGHISFPLNALVICSGGMPAEAVLRGMYYAGHLERRYNLRIPLAIEMENQTLPYGLGALWAGAGARYSWKGICGCDSQVPYATLIDRDHEIYWWVGPDGSRILMKWNSLLGTPVLDMPNQGIGGYAEARYPGDIVEFVDTGVAFRNRYPYDVIGCFGKGWDDLSTTTNEFVTTAQAKTNATRQVIVSNELDFFRDFETLYGSSIPSMSASFGNEWDAYCAALAEVSARVKRAVEKLRSAEGLATLVSLPNPNFMRDRQEARDRAWMNIGLFWEHNFGMVFPPSGLVNERITWQRRLASEIEGYVGGLQEGATGQMGTMIRRSGTETRFFAYNPLSWMRTDYADFPYAGTGPVHVIDLASGQEAPSQWVNLNSQPYLRIWAQDVPPVGYKVFEIRRGTGQTFPSAPTASGNVLENAALRVTVAERGAITSLVDKSRGNREFARSVAGRVLNDLGDGTGSIEVENAGPVSATLRATASGPLSHITRITLFRDSDRVEIRNEITQGFSNTHTWAFGFDLNSPDLWHEEVGAVIRASLLPNGGHYSPRNARYDWLTLNHFADMSGGGVGVTLSNADCFFMRRGNSTASSLDETTPQISVLAGGRVVNGNNGIPNQGGDTRFLQRFALRTHDAYDQTAAMRFALEHQNPLVTGIVTGGDVYPETSFSLLEVSDPNVLLWALKPAEDGIEEQGVIVRLWNMSPSPASVTVSFPNHTISSAQRVTHIETPLEEAPVVGGRLVDALAPQQLRTWAVQLVSGPSSPTNTPTSQPTATITPTPSSPTTTPTTGPTIGPKHKRLHLPLLLKK